MLSWLSCAALLSIFKVDLLSSGLSWHRLQRGRRQLSKLRSRRQAAQPDTQQEAAAGLEAHAQQEPAAAQEGQQEAEAEQGVQQEAGQVCC